jgi:hypothetical protein
MTYEHYALICIGAALIGWDIWLAVDDKPGNTISEIIRRYSRKYLFIPVAIGVLIGHWFW